jgi:hypothetical protein
MNPNLQYAEHAKGLERQQPWGIIRGRQFLDLDRTVQWIEPSEAWTDEDTHAWKAWLSEYLDWLLTSEMGKREARAWNNHGTWYDVQAAYIALRAGREAVAREILAAVGEKRIAKHLLPDGRQTKELIRTKSWDYSVMNLEGLFTLARLAEPLDIDLWHFETEDGRQLRDALDYLAQYVLEEKEWPHKQIVPFQPERLYPLLVQAAEVYGDEYRALAGGIDPGAVAHLRIELQQDLWRAIK